MELNKLLNKAKEYQDEINSYREYLHQNPELGMNLDLTKEFVKHNLRKMGYEPQEICNSGIVACAGGEKPGKVILLRADMDALPMKEETELPFKSINDNMHACGHDMHTAMLLGAAKVLKEYEDEIEGTVKFMFQPGEETGDGAKEMVKANVLCNPDVDAAMMIHVTVGGVLPSGIVLIPNNGVIASSSDTFRITIHGKGGHGATPNETVDPINIAAHLVTSLQTINSREVQPDETIIITLGKIQGGAAPNIIPDTLILEGTIRAFKQEIREFAKKRLTEIANTIAQCFRGTVIVDYLVETSPLVNDKNISEIISNALENVLKDKVMHIEQYTGKRMTGSEDFSEISVRVPSIMIIVSVGSEEEGYNYAVHHPKVVFDHKQLHLGAAVYAIGACSYLENKMDING